MQATVSDLWRYTNAQKLLRYTLPEAEVTVELETARATKFLNAYFDGLKLGKDLPETDLQPADDLAILTGQVLVNLWKLSGQVEYLYHAAAVLEYASSRSKQSFQIRLHLVRIYRLIGMYATLRLSGD